MNRWNGGGEAGSGGQGRNQPRIGAQKTMERSLKVGIKKRRICRHEPGKEGGWGEWKCRNRNVHESTMSCDADDRPLKACLDLSGDTWKCEPADIQKARKTRSRRVATARDRAQGVLRSQITALKLRTVNLTPKATERSSVGFKQGNIMNNFS